MQPRNKQNRLISKPRLKKALQDYLLRNELIAEIDKLDSKAKLKFEKTALIFWLGNNISREGLGEDKDFMPLMKWLYIGYYISLILEKHINAANMTPGQIMLARCRSSIFQYYSSHYQLLREDPETLFTQFQHFIQNIDTSELNEDEKTYVIKVQALCLNELNRVLNNADIVSAPVKIDVPLPQSLAVTGESLSLNLLINGHFTTWLNKYLTRSGSRLHPFFANQMNPAGHKFPHARKIFLPAKDGTVIEGLYVARDKYPSQSITLALAGHFQAEHIYLGNAFDARMYSHTFGNDVVFINHRNFSLRAGKLADHIDDIANDCAWFAKYFQHLGHEVNLYGMCGGAPHMILAARELTKADVNYKLVLDRTFKSYSTVFAYNNVSRNTAVYDAITGNKSWRVYLENRAILLGVSGFLQPALDATTNYAGVDYNFAEIALSLPEENVLVLQGKSAKNADSPYPKSTDGFVAPQNDMRNAFKTRRQQEKQVFKKLCALSVSMFSRPLDHATQKLFQDLHVVFNHCLNLIDNEKLQAQHNDGKLKDIHSEKLHKLETRTRMGINTFIQGFFADMPASWREQFDAIKTSPDTHHHALYHAVKTDGLTVVTTKHCVSDFMQILKLIFNNKDLIARMTFRAKASKLHFNEDVFKHLINSRFHQSIPALDLPKIHRRR